MKRVIVLLLSLPLLFVIHYVAMVAGWGIQPQSLGVILSCWVSLVVVQALIAVVSK